MKMRFLGLLSLCLTLGMLGLSACGSGSSGSSDSPATSEDGDQVSADGDADSSSDFAVRERPSDSLTGLWAMNFAIAYTTQLPVFNKPALLILTGVARLESTQNGQTFAFTEHVCDFDMRVVTDVDFGIAFSKDSVAAIPLKPRTATVSAAAAGATFTAPNVLDIYGANQDAFSDPLTDALPTACANWPSDCDARVVDFENDGHPGLTGRVTGSVSGVSLTGEVYVVMRMIRQMSGTLSDVNHMGGQITSDVEMVTLDASSLILNKQMPLTPLTTPELNRFEAIRLDRDYDCATLMAKRGEFFTYDPTDYLSDDSDGASE